MKASSASYKENALGYSELHTQCFELIMAFSLLTAEKSELALLFSQKGPVVYELRHLRIETGDKRFQDGTYLVDAGNPANREIKIFFHKLLPAV